ncbi:velvet factor-domain-containing protein [Roridomyces roridus]|uniref:Velvet factor-domain-containing protein n=1 Tax=Roridomyces roridus TaxID=1738132 RepID=A0AAD7FK39_9AGAR|nr:velvet factor-domain-containing protein [Roridomyces roridus]
MYSQQYSGLHQFALPGPATPHSRAPSLIIPPAQQNGACSYPQGTTLIGKPIHFTEGQFAGRTIRAELQELQAASFGRKYAKVDRRPLDPPPVAWLRLFEVHNAGTDAETEIELDYDHIHCLGLMCTVDLLPVAQPPQEPASPYSSAGSSSIYDGFAHAGSMSPPGYSLPRSPGSMSQVDSYTGAALPQKATTALAGTTFVAVDPIPLPEKGKTCLLFTFNDLAVKTEGYFILNYRFFDLFSRPTGHTDQPIQADCCGKTFRIYSSKEVPPLGASTELTKHLLRYGVRVNVRETERKRKKKSDSGTTQSQNPASPYTTTRVPDRLNTSDASDDD